MNHNFHDKSGANGLKKLQKSFVNNHTKKKKEVKYKEAEKKTTQASQTQIATPVYINIFK